MQKIVRASLLVLFLFYGSFLSALSLSEISREDRDLLEREFSYLFSGDLGYTLTGSKPVSIEYLCDRPWEDRSHADLVVTYLKKIFERSGKFVFLCHQSGSYRELILVYKPCLRTLINRERDFLERQLKRPITEKTIIEALENQGSLLDSVTLGVLLGYGKENSFFFARRAELLDYLPKALFLEFTLHPSQKVGIEDTVYVKAAPFFNTNFSTYRAELNWVKENDMPWPKLPEVPFLFQPVLFVAKSGVETSHLHEQYNLARERLAQHFANKSFLEIVIQLAQP